MVVTKTHSSSPISAESVVIAIPFFTMLDEFLAMNDVPRSRLAQVAWCLTLRCYIGIDKPSFPSSYEDERCVATCTASLDGNPWIRDLLKTSKQAGQETSELNEIVLDHKSFKQSVNAGLFNTALSVSDAPLRHHGSFDHTQYILQPQLTRVGSSHFLELRFTSPWIHNTQATHIANTFVCALENIIINPERPSCKVDLFSQFDLWQISQWNSRIHEPVDSCAHIKFEESLATHRDAEAIHSWDGSLTYAELDRLSSGLALMLREQGVGPEKVVPLCFEKSYWAVVAMLCVWKAGGVWVCLDPHYPDARRQSILRSVEATLVVASQTHADIFDGSDLQVLIAGPESKGWNATRKPQPSSSPTAQPGNAAYIVFTSGSTGEPKGIVVEHRALCTSLREQTQAMEVGYGSRFLQYAAYTFDVSVGDIFTTLTSGGCLCIPSDNERHNGLAGAMEHMRVNQACLTSSVASLLRPSDVPSLKHLTLGGEPASRQNVTDWADVVTLNNVYGPAECTIWCVINRKLASDENESSIGRGIGATTWIVDPDEYKNLMPVGAVGELLLEGPVLAKEYFKNPDKTTKAFITEPAWTRKFDEETGRRFYKTGDLVRYDHSGNVVFQGRKDTQIKLRGQRIELGEIEHHLTKLLQHPLSLAAELVIPTDGNTKIAAFICLGHEYYGEEDMSVVADSTKQRLHQLIGGLSQSLTECLPSYMVPSLFLPLKNLPLNLSGKVDRKRLRAIAASLSP